MSFIKEITLVETDIELHNASPFYGQKIYIDNDVCCVLVHLCKAFTKKGKQCTNRQRTKNGFCNTHYNQDPDPRNFLKKS